MITMSNSIHQAARCGPFFIVMNAASGHNDASDEQRVVASVLTAAGREFEFLEIDKPASIAAVCARAVALAQARNGVVVAAGGDGTKIGRAHV